MDHMLKCFLLALGSAVLFFALSPGVLLTLPPCTNGSPFIALNKDKDKNDDCVTSYEAAGLHAVIFGILMFILLCLSMHGCSGDDSASDSASDSLGSSLGSSLSSMRTSSF